MTAMKKSDVTVTAGIRTPQRRPAARDRGSEKHREPITKRDDSPTVRIPWLTTLISAMNRMMLQEDQGNPGEVHRQRLDREGHDQGDPRSRQGRMTPGWKIKEADEADQKENVGDVRIAERGEDLCRVPMIFH